MNTADDGESVSRAERLRRNAEIAELPPIGGGPLTMAEIVEAVRAARDQEPRVRRWD